MEFVPKNTTLPIQPIIDKIHTALMQYEHENIEHEQSRKSPNHIQLLLLRDRLKGDSRSSFDNKRLNIGSATRFLKNANILSDQEILAVRQTLIIKKKTLRALNTPTPI